MYCPACKAQLDKVILCNVELDYCPNCFGLWFEENEFQWAKDSKDRDLRWLDIDIWQDRKDFKISPDQKLCPFCRLPFYEVRYGDSDVHPVKSAKGGAEQFNGVKIDVCNLCHGIWLDRGEFNRIIDYLKRKGEFEILHNYAKNLAEEFWEIFAGPESLRDEILDLLAILKLLNYKFATQYPVISKAILQLPK